MATTAEERRKREKISEWFWRGIAMIVLGAIYVKVDKIPVHESKIDDHERRLDKIEKAMFVPMWSKEKSELQHAQDSVKLRDSMELIEFTVDNLAYARDQIVLVDLLLENGSIN